MHNYFCNWLVTQLRSIVSFWKFYCVLFSCSIKIELCNTTNVSLSLLFWLVQEFFIFFSKVFIPMICFREVFLRKAIVLPNIFFKVLLIFIMCKCLFITSLIFGNLVPEYLHVMEKRVMSAQIGLEVYEGNLLSRMSTLLIWLWMLVSL